MKFLTLCTLFVIFGAPAAFAGNGGDGVRGGGQKNLEQFVPEGGQTECLDGGISDVCADRFGCTGAELCAAYDQKPGF